jgi:hypothetical protein
MSDSVTITKEAYDSFMEIIDDALNLSKEALAIAEGSQVPVSAPAVVLTKVASEIYDRTAKAVHKTGVYPGKTVADIASTLRNGGSGTHLDILEKLASSAMFPIEVNFGGELVEKSANTPSSTSSSPKSKTAVWQQAWDEAGEELDR